MAKIWTSAATSIDLIQNKQYNCSSLHGVKRSAEQLDIGLPDTFSSLKPSDACSGRDFAKRQCLDFGGKARLEASKICNVVTQSNNDAINGSIATRHVPLIPGLSQNPLLSLSHSKYGLPKKLVENFTSLGINSIYPWQSSCLLGRGLLDGSKNLVYTAPTGGGKSLVADVLMLKRVIEDPRKKAILVLPYVALVQEKLKWLRRLVEDVQKSDDLTIQSQAELPKWCKAHNQSIRVAGFFGGSKAHYTWSDVNIAVCTIEKANSLINSAIEECTINDLGIVVLDELHMINDDHRGYLMEILASKLLVLDCHVQIVGMSATLTNTEVLSKWLDAKFYDTKYEPVPIKEYLVYDNSTYPITTATIETASAGFGALIFCGGRQECQSTALLVSEAMPRIEATHVEGLDRRRDVLSDLRSLAVGLDETLERTIVRGVGFHHAGLTVEERDIIAEAYDRGVITVIVATCSLAAGINLPARRVILHGARMGRDLIGPAMLRQMRGRAGRKGKDEIGESYLCCLKADLDEVAQLLEADLPMVESSLIPEKRGINGALLEVITVRLATHLAAIQDYVQRTLLYHTMDHVELSIMVVASLNELIASNLIILDNVGSYEATLLSQATVASYLNPEDGLFLHDELRRALRAFVMDGDMHIFYTFTPLYTSGSADINWPIFRREMESLDESGLRGLEFVGINPGLVNRMANSAKTLPESTPEEIRTARIYRRFYAALQLRDLCNEIPIHVVARKYVVPRGFVQTLAQICEGFGASMIKFCDKMGWGMLRAALEHMSDRLKAGARADLLELAKIPFVKSRTARVFWENGFKGLSSVAEVDAKELIPILLLAQPKKSRLDDEEEKKYHQKLLLKAEIIVGAANRLWERQQQLEIETDI